MGQIDVGQEVAVPGVESNEGRCGEHLPLWVDRSMEVIVGDHAERFGLLSIRLDRRGVFTRLRTESRSPQVH